MNASLKKRFLAYIIDFIFIFAILMLVYYALPKSSKYYKYNDEITVLTDKLLANQIGKKDYIESYATLSSQIDKENIVKNIFDLVVILIYFVIMPIFTYGQTLGKYIMKIKIKKEKKKLNFLSLLIRNIVVNGLGYLILSLILINILNSKTYFLVISILAFIQVLSLIINGFMVLYRHDKRGLGDILSNTVVVGR